MDIPLSWLRELVPSLPGSIKEFMEDMTLIGMTAESHTPLGEEITNVVVGRMAKIEKHPNADKLLVTQVDIGEEEPLQIVTGAMNLKVGDYVPVALHSATLADGLVIKKGKLRGETSNGMLCSIEELGYTREDFPESPEDGIYVFQEPHPLGADARPILQLLDDVIEFELTSNRPDCQSVIGIAREAAARYGSAFEVHLPNLKEEAPGSAEEHIQVEIENPDLCPRYAARVVTDVKIEPSPQWLRRRLTTSGVRPINNIVDITNYVMLEYGQPLHAFDISTIADAKIIVRTAKNGETITTLDGVERQLDFSMLVIADAHKPQAIAGVMGGEHSKITGEAGAILFESAAFNGTNVRLTSKKLGLRTDASARFERGLDPNLPLAAINRAVELVEALGAGKVFPGVVDNYPASASPAKITFSPTGINRLLGTDIPARDMQDYLARIGIATEVLSEDSIEAAIEATIPTFRADLQQEADIAEEVARFFGYGNIPTRTRQVLIDAGAKTKAQRIEDAIKNIMTALNYCEALTSTIESPKVFDKLNIPPEERAAVTIVNPLGEDFSIMRTTPLNWLLNSLAINQSRRHEEARLFELAKVYIPVGDAALGVPRVVQGGDPQHTTKPRVVQGGDPQHTTKPRDAEGGVPYETVSQHPREESALTELPEEKVMLVAAGYNTGKAGVFDFFHLKGDAEVIFEKLGIEGVSFSPDSSLPYMHPGRTAAVKDAEGAKIGCLGELHPIVAAEYDLSGKPCVMVLELQALINLPKTGKTYVPLPKYPGIVRDLALIAPKDVTAGAIEAAIKEKGGKQLVSVSLFDVYEGAQVAEGCKSMAYSLSFRAEDRTLTEKEVAGKVEAVLANLEEKLAVRLRT